MGKVIKYTIEFSDGNSWTAPAKYMAAAVIIAQNEQIKANQSVIPIKVTEHHGSRSIDYTPYFNLTVHPELTEYKANFIVRFTDGNEYNIKNQIMRDAVIIAQGKQLSKNRVIQPEEIIEKYNSREQSYKAFFSFKATPFTKTSCQVSYEEQST